MSQIDVTELDFSKIKQSIKDYISDQDEFKDYNFQGSVVNLLLDMLAYNSYQNAFYTSMVGNEMFLDSAQLRDSVVSRAKMLDYIPASVRSARTSMSISYNETENSDVVTIPKGEAFKVTSDTGEVLQFVTDRAYNVYKALNYTTEIDVFEGIYVDQTFTVSESNPVKYVLTNTNIDTASITVTIRQALGSTNTEIFTLANNIEEVKSTSAVYFLQEVVNGTYEIYFGDDNIGKKLIDGNIVEVNYRVSVGDAGNDVRTDSPWSAVDLDITINSVSNRTYDGANIETIESIKYNAPKNYETQNRAVLAEDYRRILLRDFPGLINSLRIWGGETNDPPVYGKVFVSIQPKGSRTLLSTNQKDDVRKQLKRYNVMTNEVEFIDPSYNYIIPSITVYYDSNATSLDAGQIANKVATTVQNFETTYLGNFENRYFRYSLFSRLIDQTDPSILYSDTKIELQKRFTPLQSLKSKYTINYSKKLINISSSFIEGSREVFFDDDSNGNLRLYYFNDLNQVVYIDNNIGTIDYESGILTLPNFGPDSVPGNEIKINAIPEDANLVTSKYLIMLLSDVQITVVDDRQQDVSSSITVTTEGSVTQINETNLGTII
jgi:hypothetical protein